MWNNKYFFAGLKRKGFHTARILRNGLRWTAQLVVDGNNRKAKGFVYKNKEKYTTLCSRARTEIISFTLRVDYINDV